MEVVWLESSFQGLLTFFWAYLPIEDHKTLSIRAESPYFRLTNSKENFCSGKVRKKYVILPFSCILLKICQFGAKSLNPSLPPFDNHRVRVNTSMTFHSGRGITFMSFHDHSIWRHMPCRFLENFKIWYFLLFCSVYKGASCKIVFFYGDKHFSV